MASSTGMTTGGISGSSSVSDRRSMSPRRASTLQGDGEMVTEGGGGDEKKCV